ncbi:MAG: hypothetical protein WCJ02_17245 [bacterium]
MGVLLFIIGAIIVLANLFFSWTTPTNYSGVLSANDIVRHIDYLIGCIFIATSCLLMFSHERRKADQVKEEDDLGETTLESKMNLGIVIGLLVIFALVFGYGFYKFA